MTKKEFGIVQGRLTPSPLGQLQWFPQDGWESEFSVAAEIGIGYVELIAERQHNPDNPLWSDDGITRIKELTQKNDLILKAFCNDFVIDHAVSKGGEIIDQNIRLLDQGAKLGMQTYIFPLFEESELTPDNGDPFIDPLRVVADYAADKGIKVCLETHLNGEELMRFLDRVERDNVAAVFDSGNRVTFGHDLPGDIRLLGERLQHFHIKDKNTKNENVILGTGLVNFADVFAALNDIGYRGPYTFETQRGNDPAKTARFNMAFASFFIEEASGGGN